MKRPNPSRELLILDIQQVAKLCEPTTVTRNYYRAHGTFTEAQWQEFYPTFGSFLQAADLKETVMDPEESEGHVNPTSVDIGDIIELNKELFRVICKRNSSFTVKPVSWFEKLMTYYGLGSNAIKTNTSSRT